MADYDVNSIWDAVERVARGAEPTAAERDAFSWLQTTFGLKRSPEQYAGRTRRRYRAAAKRGESAQAANKRDYEQRKAKKQSPRKRNVVKEITPEEAKRRWERILDAMDYRNSFFRQASTFDKLDEDEIANAILAYGYDTVLTRILEEAESAKQYALGKPEKGHNEWYGDRTMKPVGMIRVSPEKSPFADEWGDLPDLSGSRVYFGNTFYLYHGTMYRR